MRVTQSSGFLTDVVKSVQGGNLVPAGMQRPYVWDKRDVQALMDSILAGYPIGSIMLWTPWASRERTVLSAQAVAKLRLGPMTLAEGTVPEALILDGQNRLASVAWMSLREDQVETLRARTDLSEQERTTWLDEDRLVFDGQARGFVFVPASAIEDGLRVPAWVVAQNSNPALREAWDRWEREGVDRADIEAFVTAVDRAGDALREARLTQTVIERATPEQAKHAFLHICRTGVPMSEADFEAALSWSASSR